MKATKNFDSIVGVELYISSMVDLFVDFNKSNWQIDKDTLKEFAGLATNGSIINGTKVVYMMYLREHGTDAVFGRTFKDCKENLDNLRRRGLRFMVQVAYKDGQFVTKVTSF